MNRTKRSCFTILAAAFLLAALGGEFALGQELPKPTLDNSLIISIEHRPTDTAAVEYIKANFPFGLYARLSFSVTHIDPVLAWNSDWTQADAGIQSFKNTVNSHIAAAKAAQVRFNLVICSGLARGLSIYKDAKIEDVRNCQWYNDNNIASQLQFNQANFLDNFVFGTFSRYALKLRRNLAAKSQAALAFLQQRMAAEPDVLAAVSGWGEAEFNDRRSDDFSRPPDWFCDYSPFAVLEFRDWIRHGGLYDDLAGIYAGQGYSAGGARYAGADGLAQFNADFGTSFSTWDLEYFHWDLADGETGPVPLTEYQQGGMMPNDGPRYRAGGFDPPRAIISGNVFWELWNRFREGMVRNLLLDLGGWVQEAGIDPKRWFSHQIPGDYLWGTSPASEPKNTRYYTSASPFWTADVRPFGSIGATVYDVKFPDWFARTSQYLLPAAAELNARWAVLEYDAEVYPQGLEVPVPPSTSDFILEQYLNVYRSRPSMINFWRWVDATGESQIRGTNKETALRELVRRIRDKAGSGDLSVVYSPPRVVGLTAAYVPVEGGVKTQIGGRIWAEETWEWKNWGDFSSFEVYRGSTADFPADEAHYAGLTSEYQYLDTAVSPLRIYYYRWRAVNVSGVRGPLSDAVAIVTSTTPAAVLSLDKNSLSFGATIGQTGPAARTVLIRNAGPAGTTLNWTAAADRTWITVVPNLGTGNGSIAISIDPAGLGAGQYAGQVEVGDPLAVNSPQFVAVALTVFAAGEDELPFGVFDTPADGAQVASSIPVTGWALDDIEVARIEIKRHPVDGDSASAIGPDGLIFIGNAVFVKGARPDVEAAYPEFPQSDRAGWGYMLLTNFLPNQGNGTFTLCAVAEDLSGGRWSLGEKTIAVDNAHAVNPFGAIDTPAQGEAVSGSDYFNFGWVLTPLPNFIPFDGSSIWVWVDGVPLGHPSYDHYRGDIATLFPGYANSNGAVGVFTLDTTAYENGVHTIVWGASDSAGNEDGIGSRYFEILNTGGTPAPLVPMNLPPEGDWEGPSLEPSNPAEGGGAGMSLEPSNPADFTIEQLGRIRFRLRGPAGLPVVGRASEESRLRFIGWGSEEGRPLPIGSTLRPETGEFFWIPGPGFLGEHVLHFAVTDGRTRSRPVRITIRIKVKGVRS